ncbi:hypothetical protein DPPLL_02260 [Desulfofustis limnaeus]|uniref:Uncharacterized protein n=1 Tax=Desulfofustis limnaeus TaxID=2740163 RepID=A0ABM7W4N5_9BACT|nr:hypothetical protein [Desulfofustis limnaeus]BDD85861.1 hypothetical protein DPPLL_02260 [Desulfofustis limnaeus]
MPPLPPVFNELVTDRSFLIFMEPHAGQVTDAVSDVVQMVSNWL